MLLLLTSILIRLFRDVAEMAALGLIFTLAEDFTGLLAKLRLLGWRV